MSLHNKVERFLSSAEILLFQKIDNNIILGLHFNKSQFDTFRDIDNYKRLNKYFNGRKITLAIINVNRMLQILRTLQRGLQRVKRARTLFISSIGLSIFRTD